MGHDRHEPLLAGVARGRPPVVDRGVDERVPRGGVALSGLRVFWRGTPSAVVDGVTARGFPVKHLHELGWLESARAMLLAREVAEGLLAPLERYGVMIGADTRASLFG